jgi:formylglycine-generating enzyme required for sulfatase activity
MKKYFSVLLLLLLTTFSYAQQKHALVIGNTDYRGISRLNNPVNDANDMEVALRGLGFTVEKVLNGNLDQMETAISNLKRRLTASRDSYGFFFYAGHGVQSNGENYLIPVEANNIQSDTHLRTRTVPLQFIMESLNDAGNVLNMIVLDACRDNPFSWNRSGTRGLSVVSRAPTGSIVMYATSADSVASDGTGRNGLFTGQLLNNLKTSGLSVFEIFDKTMGDVINITNENQHPELSLRFPGAASVYLGSRPVTTVRYPMPDNMVRINGGTFIMGSPTNEPGREKNEGPQHQVTISSFYIGKYPVTQKEWYDIMGTTIQQRRAMVFRIDMMSERDLEYTLHGVGDNYPMYYVSWYNAIEYCNRRSQLEGLTQVYTIDKSRGDPNRVNNFGDENWIVTWNRNANGYRLPTEAEWEYACRAGTTTAYSTGTSINGSTIWYGENNNDRKIHPVGQKLPNQWGLYDMPGNVWEWCWDWYGDYLSGTQTDPIGPSSGNNRIIRGGGGNNEASTYRSAFRSNDYPTGSMDAGPIRCIRLVRQE